MEKEELIRNLGTNITMCFLEGCPRADKCLFKRYGYDTDNLFDEYVYSY